MSYRARWFTGIALVFVVALAAFALPSGNLDTGIIIASTLTVGTIIGASQHADTWLRKRRMR